MTISETITADQAQVLLVAGQAHAAAMGVHVIVAVLDAGAHLKAFARMDGAVLGSIDVAIGKARTAALFGTSSAAVWDYCQPGAPAPNLQASNGGLMPFPGGVPLIDADGVLIGAIGVSGGAPSQDLAIAEAALATLNG
ncbi:GlcG/HbpS family heme-binding protein [Allosphingosinicella deserti]|uniref:Glycolate utilization protein n=1 Tax=Allosphingosinicella deserti TaxID=2116704 RepID=A0A2P7QEV2_9SPHN|nr:heme-binding protein [Sphingomonas deserti]PSJ36500.1 glycolate utilization protein [Sphingomonas deserti]